MKLLIKFPTRNRPTKFIEVLDLYYNNLSDKDNTKFIISCDIDDETMNNDLMTNKLKKYKNLEFYYSYNKNKIEAVNADMNGLLFDIVLLASDDMIPQVFGYDDIIRNNMRSLYPDTDGVLWYNDGLKGRQLNTLCILGKKYYDRFGYIYHPSYKSQWCDNEFMVVGDILKKQTYIDNMIIKHIHPPSMGDWSDILYQRNETMVQGDCYNYHYRLKNNFDLK